MRYVLLPALILGTSAWAQAPSDRPAVPDKESARTALAMEVVRKGVGEFTLRRVSGEETSLALVPEPILKVSNPIQGSVHGAVYVWTDRGRPAVIASGLKNFQPARHVGIEFHSLSTGLVTAEREGEVIWHPARAGVEFKPIPGAPAPAGSPAARLRQMRALAGQFSATHTTREDITRGLRLLTQPLFRNASPESDRLDGALFVFVQGTDPEVVLLIEAQSDDRGEAGWCYAPARMSYTKLDVAHQGHPVWKAPMVPWWVENSKLYDRDEPYTEFIFRPGQGVNPAELPEDVR